DLPCPGHRPAGHAHGAHWQAGSHPERRSRHPGSAGLSLPPHPELELHKRYPRGDPVLGDDRMRASWRFLMPGLAVLFAGCAGCSSTPSAPPPKSTASFSLIELLGKPRSELAALTDEWLEKARLQEKAHREGRMPYS